MADDRVSVVLNKRAGGGTASATLDAIISTARSFDVEVSVHTPASLDAAHREMSSIVARGASRLVVVGGDGMVHHAVQHVAGTGCILGNVPAGTGNDFATALGLSTDIDRAVAGALGPARAIDAVRVGSNWAASIVTFGFSAAVNERAEAMRFPRGPSRYTIATLLELPRLCTRDVTIGIDGKEVQVRASIVAIANTSTFGGGMRIAPNARYDDGLLDVVIIADVRPLTLLRMLRKVFSGTHVGHDAVTVLRGHRVVVGGEASRVRADGEPLCEIPFEAVAARGALLVAGAQPSRE